MRCQATALQRTWNCQIEGRRSGVEIWSGVGSGTLGSQQQWMETLHWQTQHFRQEHSEAQILRSKSNKIKGNSQKSKLKAWIHRKSKLAPREGTAQSSNGCGNTRLVKLRLHFMQNKNLLAVKQAIIRRVLGFEIAAAWVQINFKISDRTQLTALHATFVPVPKKRKKKWKWKRMSVGKFG